MTRRRKIVLSILAIIGITAASLTLGNPQANGGCAGCAKAEQGPDGGGEHHLPDQSEDIDSN